jgi:amino acid adenylation domain-containing protein
MRDLESRLAALPPEARRLLELRLRREKAEAASAPVRRGLERAPLSFAQRRLWFMDRLEPGAAYNSPLTLRVRGALDAPALERALAEVVCRHEVLRSVIRAGAGGEAEQVVLPAGAFPLSADDLSTLPAAAREDEARRIVHDEIRRPFDLGAGPLFRARLLRLGDDDHVLVLAMHHVVSDGWSLGVLFRELGALYDAFRRGAPSPLPPLPLQYADHAAWERAHWTDERLAPRLEWWRRALEGAPDVLELPTDRPRPAAPSHRGARMRVTLPRELAEGVRELARREGATPFMVMLAAFDVLLWRWSGQEDLVVGSPVAGRTRAETEGLIGFFVNTLPLRADLSGDPAFVTLLHRVRETALGAQQHQELPFERLVEALHPGRSAGHAPVFQTVFALQNATPAELRLPGLRMEVMATELGTSRFDLEWLFWERGEGITGTIDYATDLFDAATVARMAAQYRRLLEMAVARPDTRVSALPLMGDDERAALLARSGAETGSPRDTIDRLFARAAAARPDAVALETADAAVTYAELDARADRLARHLRRAGATAGARVGICLERGPELIVATLAAVKAGAAYVPLDPSYPPERLSFILRDTAVRVVVTTAALAGALPGRDARVVRVDEDAAAIAAESAGALASVTDAESPACVMYTSGSTGTPKGVEVPHRAVVRLVRGQDFISITPDDVFLQLAPASFDAATLEIWGPLLNGARLAVHPPAAPTVESIAAAVERHGVTTLWLTAGLFHLVVDQRIDALRPVRRLLAGGDVLSAPHARRVLDELINGYGPTENTTFTCCHAAHAEDVERGAIPIGRPIGGTRAYVLDAWMRPVPAGVPGELFAGGAGLAHGYVGRPALTAEKFVPDPFADGGRLYRTGDRVRWTESASVRECVSASETAFPRGSSALPHSRTHALQFLGRGDRQVKIRGHRVEPGEIEAALRAHPAVADVAVVPREDAPGDRRLVAYVVAAGGAAADAAGLRAHLSRRLPAHLVPAAFVTLPALPLTANGKVDRRALPAPELAAAQHVPPRTEAERAVADVFAEVLGAERVGAADDFFALGGHSLLAMHAVEHLRDRVGADLPLRALFEHPTVESLAAALESAPATGAADGANRVTPRPREGGVDVEPRPGERVRAFAAPVSFGQQRLWTLDRMDPGRAIHAVPLALRLRGGLDADALRRALDALAARHESLRTVFRWLDAGPMQVVLPDARLPLESTDLLALDDGEREAELRRRLAGEAARPFDLERGPLARARLYRLGAREHVLLLNLHHIVTDGWSTGLLLRELAALYGAFQRGRPSPLGEPALQYADWAAWQRERLGGDFHDRLLAFWKRTLAGAPALLELPADRPRPPVWDGRGASERFRLPREMADAVDALARAEACTPFMVLLAAFQALLGRYARADDVVVGTPVANRTRPESRGIAGFFVNTLALRGDLSGDPGFRALLHRARDAALGAFAHQEMPFERLVDELKVPRSAAHAPVFQVMFSLDTATDDSPSLPGLSVERVPVPARQALFDLTLALHPRADGIDGALEYATSLFDRETALRMIAHFRTLLAAACAAPDARISALPLMREDEAAAALRAWEGPPLASPPAAIHARIAERAARTPDAVAVDGGAERVTYAELEDRASRLAVRLRALGVRRGSLVAIRAERSVETVAAVLAVLKAGGAYLPLDPAYPAERQAYMLADSGAALLLDATGAGAPAGFAGRVAALASEPSASAAEPGACRDDDEVGPDDLAYVIYTSGSTGQPRGVAVPHRALGAYVDAARRAYHLTPADRFLQFAPLSFDSSVEEIFAPLAAGAAVVLRDAEMLESADGFWRACARRSLTLASLPTAFWHELAAALDRAEPIVPPTLRVMIVGGERALPERVASWRRVVGDGVRLINSYGPTETTVAATLHDVRADEPAVPIGRAMPGYRVRVLDAALRPAPTGVPGQLFVGGVGVARGYLHRPAATAERFVPDPFAHHPGERMYATGDLARWRADGTLEFLGRTDDQVKVRGFRVELGEIESALRRHPGVRDAVATVREDTPGDRRLVACLVGDGDLSVAAVRAALGDALPAYMVPSAFVVLDALPLSPSGKVDRRALPAPRAHDAPPAAPLTRHERAVADVWRQVLGTDAVGPDDNFFDLGGNSLLLIRLAGALQERFGSPVTAVELFRFPTVRALAGKLAGASPAADAPAGTREGRLRQGTHRLLNLRRGAPA